MNSNNKLPLEKFVITFIILGLITNILCIYFLFDEAHSYYHTNSDEYMPHILTSALSLMSVAIFSIVIFISYKRIYKPYTELKKFREELSKTIQIPHHNPNPIFQFNQNG